MTMLKEGFGVAVLEHFKGDIETDNFAVKLDKFLGDRDVSQHEKDMLFSILLLDRMGSQNRLDVENLLDSMGEAQFDPLFYQKQNVIIPGRHNAKARAYYCGPISRLPVFLYCFGICYPSRTILTKILNCEILTSTVDNVKKTYDGFMELYEHENTLWKLHPCIDQVEADEFFEALRNEAISRRKEVNHMINGKDDKELITQFCDTLEIHPSSIEIYKLQANNRTVYYLDPMAKIFKLYAFCKMQEKDFEGFVRQFHAKMNPRNMMKINPTSLLLLFATLGDVEMFALIDELFGEAHQNDLYSLRNLANEKTRYPLLVAAACGSTEVVDYILRKTKREELDEASMADLVPVVNAIEEKNLKMKGSGLVAAKGEWLADHVRQFLLQM